MLQKVLLNLLVEHFKNGRVVDQKIDECHRDNDRTHYWSLSTHIYYLCTLLVALDHTEMKET
jgi:hypothetical protein